MPPHASGSRGDKSWFTPRSFQKKLVLLQPPPGQPAGPEHRILQSGGILTLPFTGCVTQDKLDLCASISPSKVETTIVPNLLGYHEDLKVSTRDVMHNVQSKWCAGTCFFKNSVGWHGPVFLGLSQCMLWFGHYYSPSNNNLPPAPANLSSYKRYNLLGVE